MPFIGLYSLVTLRPSEVINLCLVTPHLPELSQLNGRTFTKAPENMSPNAPDVARIFSSFGMKKDVKEIYGRIPLSPSLPDFAERRFWRLPAQLGAVLAMLVEHALTADSTYEEIKLARAIQAVIELKSQQYGVSPPSNVGSPTGGGPSGEGPSGGGPSSETLDPRSSGSGGMGAGTSRGVVSSGGHHLRKRKRSGNESNSDHIAFDQIAEIREFDIDQNDISKLSPQLTIF
jgi:hypothetical protein